MTDFNTLTDILALIDNGIEEGSKLEYKSKLSANKDIAKEICAFANSQGGTIIYGVLAKDRIPTEIQWISEEHSEEKIHNILEQSIQPLISGVEVKRIQNPKDTLKSILVVNIPPSTLGPHMIDGRYHKRRGSVSSPMDHEDIKAAMLGSGRDAALRFEISANIKMLDKTYSLVEQMSESNNTSLVPNLALVPLHSDAWHAIITGGFLFSFTPDMVENLIECYSSVHELNSVIEWINNNESLLIVTPIYESSYKHGIYIPAVMRDKVGKLRNLLLKLKENMNQISTL